MYLFLFFALSLCFNCKFKRQNEDVDLSTELKFQIKDEKQVGKDLLLKSQMDFDLCGTVNCAGGQSQGCTQLQLQDRKDYAFNLGEPKVEYSEQKFKENAGYFTFLLEKEMNVSITLYCSQEEKQEYEWGTQIKIQKSSKLVCLESGSWFRTFVWIVVLAFVVYFVVGFLYLRLHEGARGSDQIPHYKFWSSLLSSIRDFFVFLKDFVVGCFGRGVRI